MHSSGMRTSAAEAVCWGEGCVCPGGVCPEGEGVCLGGVGVCPGEVSARGCLPRVVSAPVHAGIHPSPVNRMTDACENITLLQLC